jgi:hypothetical protein
VVIRTVVAAYAAAVRGWLFVAPQGERCHGNPVDVAIRRWQKYTGDSAIHAVTGKCFEEVASSPEVSRD